ncbi:MAG TPA: hypothetical protein VEO56_12510 [Bacteroidota bacterium]|nr:hypothetical protein [Bacteroidota bacterium]
MKMILIAAILASTGLLHSQDLPIAAKKAIDARFSHWALRPKHIPNPCDQFGIDRSSFPPIQECNLNGDGKPDYAVAVTLESDSFSIEYFLALTSNGDEYGLNVFDSIKHNEGSGGKLLEVVQARWRRSLFGQK